MAFCIDTNAAEIQENTTNKKEVLTVQFVDINVCVRDS